MSLRALWSFLAIALPVLAALLAPMSTVDLTYQLRAGAEILATSAIPTTDTWTFTAAGLPWFDQQWGAQVIFRLAEQFGGWTGLALVRAALTGAIVASLFFIARHRGLDVRVAALLTLGAFIVAAPAMALRPQLMGMALFAAVLAIIAARRSHPRWLWVAPLVVAIWANVHGSFFLGPLALGLAWLTDVHDRAPRAHRTLVVALLSVVAACVTPFGPAIWAYAAGLSSNAAVTTKVSEWQPTSLRTGPGILFFASIIAVVGLLARRGRATPWPTLVWLAAFGGIGAYAERGVAWWPLAAFVAVVGLLEPRSDREGADFSLIRRVNAGTAAAIVIISAALLPAWRQVDPGTRAPAGLLTDAPSGITAVLRERARPGDRIFNPQRWGSWFEYAVPETHVAIDSRVEFFPAWVWDEYEAILTGTGAWENRLREQDIQFVVTDRTQNVFVARLNRAGWSTVHQDPDGAVLIHP